MLNSFDLPNKKGLRILVLGDVVGKPGRQALEQHLRPLRQRLEVEGSLMRLDFRA